VGIPVGVRKIIHGIECDDSDLRNEISGSLVQGLTADINIFNINGDMVELTLAQMNGDFPKGKYNIVYPMWELSTYPKPWADQLNKFDEVWAPSKFTYDSLRSAVSKPVIHMPLPGEFRLSRFLGRRYFGIRESSFAFLFFFDFTSYLTRKNPFAVLRAFEELCRHRPQDDLCLVIKVMGGETRKEDHDAFHEHIARFQNDAVGNAKVIIIDTVLTDNEIKNLLRCCDCFVSLHRSEGFGLGMITAMYMNKPVVATGYSANLDFMNERNSCLVRYDLRDVPKGAYPFSEGQVWADADVTHAVDHMLKLVSDQDYARDLGETAGRDIRVNFSYRAIGLSYLRRINEILHQRAFIQRTDCSTRCVS